MSKVERKAIDFVTERKNLLMFLIISIFGLVIRVKLISFRSFDFSAFLSPWYYQIRNMGGLKALRTQVGNYGILYQFLIALFTYLPGKSIFWYKALSIFFDYILAISGAKICERISNDKGKLKPLLVYSVILFSPTVIFNSCAWGQCDSIYVSFICLSLLSMLYNKNRLSFILLGIAFAFKLQTIFILPFYLLAYLKNKDFSICDIMLSFVSFYCCGLPGVIMRHDLLAPFKPFLEQTNTYNRIINLCYPNFSGLLYHGLPTEIGAYKILSSFFIFLTIGVIVIGSFYLMFRKDVKFSEQEFILFAIWIAWTCVMFLPSMHDRYGYVVEILLIVVSVIYPIFWLNTIILVMTTFMMYLQFLFSTPVNIATLSFIAVINYSVYTMISFSSIYLFLTRKRKYLRMENRKYKNLS